ncbi:MAG: acyl-CoA thioesterase [Gammaproteobacteria bacterium]|nr:acyl-CoA thioesterase [Gammaproteobacteria bacterium]
MFTTPIQPRFSETDALGHINNTVVPVWFESARTEVFQIFNPQQDLNAWNLIIAKIEVNFLAQISYQQNITIQTQISKIGNSSFTVLQEAIQDNKRVAWGEAVMVKFDYASAKSVTITEHEREQLTKHLIDKSELTTWFSD